ncbi:MAG: peptidoglycan/LPS O-acetylase OafA/YrhL [Cocleimonas sp.]|jgi:peptidoglycan/LPS O-acetylase OafA/YrhL
MKQTEYLKSINWFRGLAIIFIYLVHVPKYMLSENGEIFIYSFFGNGTFYFIFISGYLFWHLKEKYNFTQYIDTKLKYVVLPYVFVNVPVLIAIGSSKYFVDFHTIDLYSVNLINWFVSDGLIWYLLVGGLSHMWFLPVIIIFFIISPVTYSLANSKYFLPVLLCSVVFSVCSFRADVSSPIYNFLHFYGVYAFGIFIKKNESYIFRRSGLFVCVFSLLFIIFIYLTCMYESYGDDAKYYYPMFSQSFDISYINLNQIQKYFGSIFVFALLFFIERKFKKLKVTPLDFCAKYSFGIYFVHMYWLVLINMVYGEKLQSYLAFSILGFALTIFSIFSFKIILKKISLNSRLFIGC